MNRIQLISRTWLTWCLCQFMVLQVPAQSFTNVTDTAGIDHLFQVGDAHFGGGAAVIDYDNDGYEDLFLPGGVAPDRFYHNNGDGTFTEVLATTGLLSATPYHCMGASAADLNNDGYKDLLLLTRSFDADINRYAPNLLYLNNGDGTFSDISISAGLSADSAFSHAATFGDVDLDGDLDIYIANFFGPPFYDFADSAGVFDMMNPVFEGRANFLYLNNGDLTFTEVGASYGVADSGAAWPVTFTDFDNDGDVDLSVGNDFGWDLVPSALFQNEYPAPVFSDISALSGMDVERTAMGVAIGDYDEDGMLEYYYTMTEFNELMDNDGSGFFTNVAGVAGVRNDSFLYARTEQFIYYSPAPSFAGTDSLLITTCDSAYSACDTLKIYLEVVPSDSVRFDSISGKNSWVWVVQDSFKTIFSQKRSVDGFFALIDTIWGPSQGSCILGDSALVSEENTVGWGCMFLDYDQDTYLDLFVANGALSPMGAEWPQENPNALFHNNGDGTFSDVSDTMGMNSHFKSRGTVMFDYDLDGDLDILIVNQNWPDGFGEGVVPRTQLMRNDASGANNWLKVKVNGTTHNLDGKGVHVKACLGGRSLIREVDGGSSIHSNHTPLVHFGLGSFPVVDTLIITWPNQCRQIFLDVAINQLFEVTEGDLQLPMPDTVPLCFGDSLMLGVTASPEYDFLWTHSGATTPWSASVPLTQGTFALEISDGTVCTYSIPFTVDLSPDSMALSGLEPYYCILDTGIIPLTLTPVSASLSGPGISGSTFSPTLADTGWHTLNLTYTDTTGCEGRLETTVWVFDYPAPVIEFDTSVCSYTAPFTLEYLPSTGTFSGPGVSGGVFDPGAASPGINLLTFTYTDPAGCSSLDTVPLYVSDNPGVEFLLTDTTMCVYYPTFSLVGVPAGGDFWGPGVDTGSFFPAVPPPGTMTLWYAFTDTLGCTWTDSQAVTTFPRPVVSIAGLSSPYLTTDPLDTLMGVPTGGILAGVGVTGNVLDPAAAGPGTFLLNYFYSDPITGCKNSIDSAYVINLATEDTPDFSPDIQAFPNPFADVIRIQLPASSGQSVTLNITDAAGKKVYEGDFDPMNSGYTLEIPTKSFPDGLYMLELHLGKGATRVFKLIKGL